MSATCPGRSEAWAGRLRALAGRALALVFRQRCVGCGAWGTGLVCGPCQAAWPAAPAETPGVLAGAAYVGPARGAVHALKYGRRRAAVGPLAAPLAAHPLLPGPTWLLVPVPLHRTRQWRRGFNQATLLARAIARRRGHRVADVLRRPRGTPKQAPLGRSARAANLAGAIRCVRPLAGARCLLVDDVYTTGATAAACALALYAAGAGEVVVLAATFTPARRPHSRLDGCSRGSTPAS